MPGNTLVVRGASARPGYIAAGSFTDASQNTGALLIKLDSSGKVQWQQDLGPASSTGGYFNTVQQTSGGGYVAAGAFYLPTTGNTPTQVLVAGYGADAHSVPHGWPFRPAMTGAIAADERASRQARADYVA
jgi:hypothetical protein